MDSKTIDDAIKAYDERFFFLQKLKTSIEKINEKTLKDVDEEIKFIQIKLDEAKASKYEKLTNAPKKPSRREIMENLNIDICVQLHGWEYAMFRPHNTGIDYDEAARVLLIDGKFDLLERMFSERLFNFADLEAFANQPKTKIEGSDCVYWTYRERRLLTIDEVNARICWILDHSQ
jgi:hypothetical protein